MKKRTKLARSVAVVFSMTLISSACYATCTLSNATVTDNTTCFQAVGTAASGASWTSGNLEVTSSGAITGDLNGLATTGPVNNLINAGTITTTSTDWRKYAIYLGYSVNSLQNSGSIVNQVGKGILVNDTINTIENTGTIDAVRFGIYNGNNIGSIFNSGVITSAFSGITNDLTTIGTITNVGVISSITNISGTITTLNNLQGGSSPLTFANSSNLPTNYNIIINSTTQYGKLSVSSPAGGMAFNIYGNTGTTLVTGAAASTVVVNRYQSVLQGFSSLTGITGTTGTYGSNLSYSLVQNATTATDWDLEVTTSSSSTPSTPSAPSGPSAADTQESLTHTATALRSVFNQQTAVINNSLNYDCTVFAENGVCVSGGGRFATTNSITGEKASTLLVASYQTMKNVRVGGFIDQNVSNPSITGVSVDKSYLYGVFGVWNQNPDATGYEVRLATNWSSQDITQARNVVGTSEAGTGTASLKSQAISGVVSYAMPVTDSTWIASPYAGIRKTKVTRGSYTETSAVTTPLTYSDLSQDITTALAGVRMNKKFSDNVYVTGSVGVEQNVGSSISTFDASGVTGLTATDFSANYAKTRPVASAGASYAIDKNQRISLSAMYRKEAFQASGSTTALLMYQVGL